MKHSRFVLAMLICLFAVTGCMGVARMSDFPRNAATFNFDELSKKNYDSKDAIWNERTEYEYFVNVEKTDENELFKLITFALMNSGYTISYSDIQHKVAIGERGLRLNEWQSITGIYYRATPDLFQVYFKNAITQDITGGLRENRAKEVAKLFCAIIMKCKRVPE
jgi:hypothetical protein